MNNYDRMSELQQAIQNANLQKQAQSEPDRVIDAAQRELADLTEQQRQEQLGADLATYNRLQQQTAGVYNRLIGQLDQIAALLAGIPEIDELQDLLDYQTRFAASAVSRYNQAASTPAHMRLLNSPDPNVQFDAREAARADSDQARSRFAPPPSRNERLAGWVNAAPTPADRQKRAGVVLALFGLLIR